MFLDLLGKHQVRGNLVTDVQLAALALEHGLAVYSADSDFARFTEITWVNPIQPEANVALLDAGTRRPTVGRPTNGGQRSAPSLPRLTRW